MIVSFEVGVLALVATLISALGWIKFVYFISLGYGFSITGMGIALLVLFRNSLTLPTILLSVLLIIYGIRLGGYLLLRELKSASYKKALPELTKTSKPMGFFAKLSIWISVVILYFMQISPVVYRLLNNNNESNTWSYIGIIIMTAALLLESLADIQKARAKKANPHRFCDTGLYKIVRCPNYFAEILFWTGCFISGIGALQGWQYGIAAVGYIGIVYIMFGGARRLELRQSKNYGSDPEYQAYSSKTPILIPLVPLYHLKDATFFKG